MSQATQLQQAPLQQLPSESLPNTTDNVGQTRTVVADSVAQGNAAAEARVAQLHAAARAKMMAEFRDAANVPAPTAQQQPGTAQAVAPQANNPAASVAPQANAQLIAEALTQQLAMQSQAAEKVRQEAAQSAHAAQRQAQEADARLQAFMANPAKYLEAAGLTLDEWNARMVNGGEPTEVEKVRAQMTKELAERTKPLEQQVTQLTQVYHQELASKALAQLTPALQQDYPLTDALLGPQATLDEIQRRADVLKKAKQPIPDNFAVQVLAEMETGFLTQQQAVLRREAVATKLGISVKSPQAEAAASQSPQTLTNRVTSTVSPTSTRATSEKDRITRGRQQIAKLIAEGRL